MGCHRCHPRAWADRDPVAAARLTRARADLKELAEQHNLPVENLLTPDYVRRLLWEPPPTDSDVPLVEAVAERLRSMGARPWQIELTQDVLATAILEAKPSDPKDPGPEPEEPTGSEP